MSTDPKDREMVERAPRLMARYPDYLDDPDGLERFRVQVKRERGHDMADVNYHSLGRLIDTIERLRFERDQALTTPTTGASASGEVERAYFERGFIAAAAWSMTKRPGEVLSDDVIDHAWEHRDEGMDEADRLPVLTASPRDERVARLEEKNAGLREAATRVQRRVGEWDALGEFTSGDKFAAHGEQLRHDAMALVSAVLSSVPNRGEDHG